MIRWLHTILAVTALAMPAYAQMTFTGAVNFGANSTGGEGSQFQFWNTLAGGHDYDLWLSLNPDATSPVNGPSDSQSSIDITLEAGQTYTYSIFGQPGASTGFNGLNLFFAGNSTNPGISAFGPTGSPLFTADSSNSTFTLQGTSTPGAGRTFYSSNGATAVLTGYEWNVPTSTSPDVCQAYTFAPGDGADFFGSFTLQVFPTANLTVSPASGTPGTPITLTGNSFAPLEKISIYAQNLGLAPRYTAVADATGAFALNTTEAQLPYGTEAYFALGQRSGDLGTATTLVSPRLALNPSAGLPGTQTTVQGFGFGAGETVEL